MQSLQLFQQMEIAFWAVVIPLMKDRKALRLLPVILFSTAAVVLSLLSVFFFSRLSHAAALAAEETSQSARSEAEVGQAEPNSGQPVQASLPPLSPPAPASPAAPNGQRNLLVIMVDSLDAASPQLETVWLLLQAPPMPRLTALPIYPTASDDSAHDTLLAHSFRLGSGQIPDPDFLRNIKERDLWWTNFVVIDRIGLGQLIDLTGGIDLGTGLTSSVNAISSLPTPEGNPQAAVLSQARLLESLCSQTSDLAVLDTAKMVDLLARHVRSDYTPEQILASWQSFQTSGVRFSCDFPTLGAFGSQVLQPPQASLIPQPNP